MQLKTMLIGMMLVVAASLATAANPSLYAAADLGQSSVSKDCAGLPATSECKDTDVALRAVLGYQFSDHLGFEGGYVDAGEISAKNGSLTSSVKASEWQFAVTGALPLNRQFSIIGKAGLSVWELEASPSALSATGRDFLVGGGVQYNVDPAFSIRAQYETHPVGDETTERYNMNLITIGFIGKF